MYQTQTSTQTHSSHNDGQHMIDIMSNYMLSPKQLMKCSNQLAEMRLLNSSINMKHNEIHSRQVEKHSSKQTIRTKHENKKYFIPGKKDQLFWLFYILNFGHDAYNMIGSNEFTHEKETKISYIQRVKENKSMLRSMKFNKLSEVESELLNDSTISLKTFHVLCILENIEFIYLDKHIFYSYPALDIDDLEKRVNLSPNTSTLDEHFENEPKHKINVIHKVHDQYGFEYVNNKLLLNYIKNRYVIDNLEHPLYSVGHYKLDEIKLIASKLNIPLCDEVGKPLKKQQLYDVIQTILQECQDKSKK